MAPVALSLSNVNTDDFPVLLTFVSALEPFQLSVCVSPCPVEINDGPQPNSALIDILAAKKYSTPTNPRNWKPKELPVLSDVVRVA